jgi:nicotinamide phosphoribosyltransferase
MNKLNKTFKINPLYESDGYKVAHPLMIANNTVTEYWTWIPRSLKYIPGGIDKIMSAGQQLVVRYLHSTFQENFFDQPIEVAQKYVEDMSKYLMMEYDFKGFENLHKLGYLPIKIKALPEGVFTKPNIPHMTGINTVDGYAWLGLYLETLISKLSWQLPTAATIAHKFKQNANEWVLKTDKENLWLTDFMCHDFHSRGGNPFSSIAIGLGHAMSNKGSDTLNVIPASRYYYDFDENDTPIYSVNASEHSVTCTGIFYYENLLKIGKLNHDINWYYSFDGVESSGSVENPDYLAIAECLNLRDWLIKFPKGILSVVSDTMDLWKVITHILPRLKDLIMAREGKLVIRPDSGDPVDIICGLNTSKEFLDGRMYLGENEPLKGVIELLWDIFGGKINEQGYKVLDPHIGAIYGDSINLERQISIYSRLEGKEFASTNIVLGIGSFTYVMLTRDSAGYAAKGAWFEIEENGVRTGFDIYKDPITDDGTKKSLKGKVAVNLENGEYVVKIQCNEEEENSGELQTIYEDGVFKNQTTLTEIRWRINQLITTK